MATQLQLRKGTKLQNDVFTGAEAELTYDSTSKGLRIHDGVTQGGYMIDAVVAWQAPTAENGYTWYRKYSSGWVEQGGKYLNQAASGSNTVTLLVTMADTNYCLITQRIKPNTSAETGNDITPRLYNVTTTSFGADLRVMTGNTSTTVSDLCWRVSGMAA